MEKPAGRERTSEARRVPRCPRVSLKIAQLRRFWTSLDLHSLRGQRLQQALVDQDLEVRRHGRR